MRAAERATRLLRAAALAAAGAPRLNRAVCVFPAPRCARANRQREATRARSWHGPRRTQYNVYAKTFAESIQLWEAVKAGVLGEHVLENFV